MGCSRSKEDVDPRTHNVGDFREEMVWERRGRPFNEVYETMRPLGEGAMASVILVRKLASGNRSVERSGSASPSSSPEHVAFPTTTTTHYYAAKLLQFAPSPTNRHKRSKLSASRLAELRHEIDVMRKLDHPNIVHLREAFWEEHRLVLVMELCEGRMLAALAGRLHERRVATSTEQLLRAVAYLHARGVVHRDLKLDNLMACGDLAHHLVTQPRCPEVCVDLEPEALLVVKLIDFGLSRLTADEDGAVRVKAAGTLSTAAPELVRGGEYSACADVWSVGACVFKLVGAGNPFLNDNEVCSDSEMRRLESAEIRWRPAHVFQRQSPKCREFVWNCMRAKASSRWTAEQALCFVSRTWLPELALASAPPPPQTPLTISVTDVALVASCSQPSTPSSARLQAAHQLDHRKAESLRRAFVAIDTDETGVVSKDELKAALQGQNVGRDEVEAYFAMLDNDHSGRVHYHEFLAATIEATGAHLLDDEALRDAFDRLDQDDTGFISQENLRAILGTRASTELVARMIAEGDLKLNGVIDFDEFTALMRRDK